MAEVLGSFVMRKVKTCKTALSRQVREAVEISQDHSHCLLNSKEEYNRCVLPTLQVEGPPNLRKQLAQEPGSTDPQGGRGGT